jgi:hypothetical protein
MAQSPVPPAPPGLPWTVVSNPGPYRPAPQEGNNWCWAAVSEAIDGFYAAGGAAMTQCQIAGRVLGANCCPAQRGGPHDVERPLDDGLRAVNHLRALVVGRAADNIVRQEIAANRPVCVRISYSAVRGHAIALIGCARAAGGFLVEFADPDPAYAGTQHRGLYGVTPPLHLSGTWSQAFLTS